MADSRFGGWTLPRTGAPVQIGIFESIGKWIDDAIDDVTEGAKVVFEKIGEAVERNAELNVPQVPMGC
ncbi:hypothetical protein M405DRAFT_816068 [Rhizopogon salebrosus TDB-379]|nr:hypothetical protein M405DRAFT_816068 [Rhizopogon salebrosus TDB-379]